MYKYLDNIKCSADLKKLTVDELSFLCDEIRDFLIKSVSETGGHLASNLGIVELNVVLEYIFDSSKNNIIFDVGHQCYVHKLLTGRKDMFSTLRKLNGLSGFPSTDESETDRFMTGHSSTSVSAMLGMAKAERLSGSNLRSIAIIGDGALTGGIAYEALNNAGRSKEPVIVVLNDNEMSISQNVGGVAKYLSKIRSRPKYYKFKDAVFKVLTKIPYLGKKTIRGIMRSKTALKQMLYHNTMFEDMGFTYLGPVDGHDIKTLISVFNRAKILKVPVFIHVNTVKGKGYTHSESRPDLYHGVSSFDYSKGLDESSKVNFSEVFGKTLCELAYENDKICAVTAAMKTGTELKRFSEQFPDRFFDVGIAEQHAAVFSAGLAKKGYIPVFAVYSSFLQRAYDQILNDIALQKLRVIFAVDRAGVVGEDGVTHQGIYDVAFLSTIPYLEIFAPSNYDELEKMLVNAVNSKSNNPVAIRYPRGCEKDEKLDYTYKNERYHLFKKQSSNVLLISYGREFYNVFNAAKKLYECGISCDMLKLNQLDSLDIKLKHYDYVFFFEEGIKNGGIAEKFSSFVNCYNYHITAFDFSPQHGKIEELIDIYGLSSDKIVKRVKEIISGKN